MNTNQISEDRILQIANDIAENMGSYTKCELIQCVTYFQDQLQKAIQEHRAFKDAEVIMLTRRIQELCKG